MLPAKLLSATDLGNKITEIEATAIFPFSLIRTRCQCAFYFPLHNLQHLSAYGICWLYDWVHWVVPNPISAIMCERLVCWGIQFVHTDLHEFELSFFIGKACFFFYQILFTDKVPLTVRRRIHIWGRKKKVSPYSLVITTDELTLKSYIFWHNQFHAESFQIMLVCAMYEDTELMGLNVDTARVRRQE